MLRESLPRIGVSGNNPRKHTNGGFFIDHIHRTAPSILLCILDGFGPILPMPYSVARSNQSNSTPTHNQRRVRTAIPRPSAQSESAAIPEIGIQKKCVWIPRRSTLPTPGGCRICLGRFLQSSRSLFDGDGTGNSCTSQSSAVAAGSGLSN